VLVDVRQRDLTIKGQEILTADKVAIRVSIIVQFRVTDPRAEPGWGVLVYPAGLAHRDFVSNALACDFSTPDVEFQCS
jgi:regulator of protease activity HflC (stomatin/prohibitin superfamily)